MNHDEEEDGTDIISFTPPPQRLILLLQPKIQRDYYVQ